MKTLQEKLKAIVDELYPTLVPQLKKELAVRCFSDGSQLEVTWTDDVVLSVDLVEFLSEAIDDEVEYIEDPEHQKQIAETFDRLAALFRDGADRARAVETTDEP